MLAFIFNDPRYQKASQPYTKLFVAFIIILEFIAHELDEAFWYSLRKLYKFVDYTIRKLVDAVIWSLILIVIGVIFTIFYTNTLFSVVILLRHLEQYLIFEIIDAIFSTAVFIMFVVLLIAYIVSVCVSLLSVPASQEHAPATPPESRPRRGILARIRSAPSYLMRKIRQELSWRVTGRYVNASILLFFSTALFFYHWSLPQDKLNTIREFDLTPKSIVFDVTSELIQDLKGVLFTRKSSPA